VIAHVGGLPFEELVPLVSGVGAGLLLARAHARAWLTRRGAMRPVRRRRNFA
jgi:hypothetical protein